MAAEVRNTPGMRIAEQTWHTSAAQYVKEAPKATAESTNVDVLPTALQIQSLSAEWEQSKDTLNCLANSVVPFLSWLQFRSFIVHSAFLLLSLVFFVVIFKRKGKQILRLRNVICGACTADISGIGPDVVNCGYAQEANINPGHVARKKSCMMH
jgi:hypothetical protein